MLDGIDQEYMSETKKAVCDVEVVDDDETAESGVAGVVTRHDQQGKASYLIWASPAEEWWRCLELQLIIGGKKILPRRSQANDLVFKKLL
jgi:hypothetical protein